SPFFSTPPPASPALPSFPTRRSSDLALMGDKLAARRVAADARVPLLPGTDAVESPDDASRLADKLGYPVILKPAAGGGGIGMTRSEEHTSELQSRSDLVCRLLLEKKK